MGSPKAPGVGAPRHSEALNIGLVFALVFVAAYRLPGGIAAVLGAVAPFVVAGFAYPLLGDRPSGRLMIAANVGVVGVSLLVLMSDGGYRPHRRG